MAAPPAPPLLTLVSGDEELLVTRAIADVVAAVKAGDPDADVRELQADQLDPAELMDLVTPSLFGEQRVLVVRIGGAMDDVVRDALIGVVQAGDPGVTLVVVHPGGSVGKRLVDAVKAAGARTVTASKPDKRELGTYLAQFVHDEMARTGSRISDGAVRALLEAVGNDLRELASACSQLGADTAGEVDEAAVARYFRGHAEVTGFAIAERAVEGNVAAALTELRLAMGQGLAAVLVTSALGRQLRTVARVASAGRASPDAIARDLKLAPWQVRKAQKLSRGWTPDALARAYAAVAAADGEVKGGGTDPGYAAERAVLAVATACEGPR